MAKIESLLNVGEDIFRPGCGRPGRPRCRWSARRFLRAGDQRLLDSGKIETLPSVLRRGSPIRCGLRGRIRARIAFPSDVVPSPNTAKALARALEGRPAPAGLIVRPLT